MHFFFTDKNACPVIKGYCLQCSMDNSQFEIIGYSQIANPEVMCELDSITHQATGICVGCGQSALFFLNATSPSRRRPVFESELKHISGNLLLSNDAKIRSKFQLPRKPTAEIPEHLPKNVERAYRDAENSYLAGHWNQAAAGYRKAIDRAVTPLVAKDEKIKNKERPMLGDKLGALERVGDIPKSMIEWIKLVKDDGNSAMHDEHCDFNSKEDINLSRLFSKTLLEYLFTLPKTIEKAQQQ